MSGFDPDAYLASKKASGPPAAFDPDKYLAEKTPMGMGESFQHGAEQGLTLGLGDEGQGALEALGQMVGIKGLGAARHLDEWGLQSPNGFDMDKFKQTYEATRDKERSTAHQAKASNPKMYGTGELIGSLAPALVGGAPATLGKTAAQGAVMGGVAGFGGSEADNLGDLAKDTAIGTGIGAVGGGLGYGAGKVLSKGAEKLGGALKTFGEDMALNATGATGKQATTFADDAGRQLLDRGIVRFGDSQSKIAGRASEAVAAANQQIDQALGTLEAKGVKVDANDVYNAVSAKIKELKADSSQADVVALLEKELEHLVGAAEARGSSDIGVLAAEQTKRGYNRKAGNWADPEKGMVGKEMYQNFRGAVEDAAQAADPATAALFKEGKQSYGLLRPIEEAAERRASTTAQSPLGGLLDMASMGAGHASGIPGAGLVTPIARRMISPRVASSAAVTADTISKLMLQSPRFQALSQSNPKAFQAMANDFAQRMTGGARLPKAAENELDRDSSTPGMYRVTPEEAKQKFIEGN